MESFKLFPQPHEDICTPFIYQKDNNSYTRLTVEKSIHRLITIAKKGEKLLVTGTKAEYLIGQREISKELLLDYLSLNPGTKENFLTYVKENIVVPTFALSLHEALIKVLVKQLISAKQAKKLFSTFIKKFGDNTSEGYAFPSVHQLKKLSIEDLKSIKLGYKAERVLEIITQISHDDTLSPHNLLSREIKGLGPWSQDILRMEFEKDYAFYPFYDLSGKKIIEECGVDLGHISKYDKKMAGDIYVYAASFLENMPIVQKKKTKHTLTIYLGYSVTNKKDDSNLPQLNQLRDWLLSKKYNVFNPTPKLSQEVIAEEALKNLKEADVIVADLSKYSHGVGFEVGFAFAKGKKIVLIAEENSKETVSKFLKGLFNHIVFYQNTAQLIAGVEKMLKS